MTRSNNHWYPRYPADYGKKTRHLSMMEHGAYALLMDYCYSTGNPLPANAVQLHRICMAFAEAEQAACMSVLHEFFIEGPDGWHNARIDEELQKRNEISDKRSKAALKRHAIAPASANANGDANAPAIAHTATATSTYKEEKESTDVDSKRKPAASRGSRLPEDWILPRSWGEYALGLGLDENEIRYQAETFRNYWIAKSGKDATKTAWEATWRNWVLKVAKEKGKSHVAANRQNHHHDGRRPDPALEQIARLAGIG